MAETLLPQFKVRVQIRPTWDASWREGIDTDGDGTPDIPMYLECLTFSLAAAPTLPEASFKWDAGKIKREDATTFTDYPLLDIKDWFVQVLADEIDESGTVTGTHRMFVGVVPSEDVALGGGSHGDQNIHAIGTEYLLDRAPVMDSWTVDTDDPTLAARLDTIIVFNEKWALGYSNVGNRSSDKLHVDPDDDTSPEAYVFSDDAEPWTAGDIIEYLLAFIYDGPVTFALGGLTDALNYVPPKYNPEGKSILEVLNDLIDRRRGLGWCVRYGNTVGGTAPDTATIHIFTVFDTAVTSDATTIPANAEQLSLDLGDTDTTIQGVVVNADVLTRYGKVIVEGEPILSMFTLSFADSTLAKGWATADEDAYKGATGSDDVEKNTRFRATVRFQNVYQAFKTPDDWDWTAGDGIGGVKYIVNPVLDLDGTIDVSGGDVTQAQFRNWGVQLADQLPLKNVETDTEFDSEYAAPFAMVKVSTGQYAMLHADQKAPSGLKMLDNRAGILVTPAYNHLLASGHFSGAHLSTGVPVYNYQDIFATVAVRTDQKLRVVVDIPYVALGGESADQTNAKTAGASGRVKRISVEGAELWYCVEGTVIGIKDDGTLDHKTGTIASRTLRDDSKHLRLIGALAKEWYGKPRSSVTVQWARPVFDYTVGNYIAGIYTAWVAEPLNSVVTRKTFDCQTMSTTIETAYGEIDAAMTAGPMGKPILPDKARARGPRFGL